MLHDLQFVVHPIKDSGCQFTFFLLLKDDCESLFAYLENFNFYDELLNSNSRLFLNHKIYLSTSISYFDFRTVIDYESFEPQSLNNKKLEDLILDDIILANFEANILNKLGLMLNFINSSHDNFYKVIIEIFNFVYPQKENLKITQNQDSITIEALSFKFRTPIICDYTIKKNWHTQDIFWEINAILQELGVSQRIFSYNNDKYFITELERGLYLMSIFNKKAYYFSRKKLPNRAIIYSERQYIGQITNIEGNPPES